jgi:hypothetical protein
MKEPSSRSTSVPRAVPRFTTPPQAEKTSLPYRSGPSQIPPFPHQRYRSTSEENTRGFKCPLSSSIFRESQDRIRIGLRVYVDSGQFLLLTCSIRTGHTVGMKVAVSIPDDVFEEAEALAKRMKSSRSEIYSRALGEFIGHHASDRVTNLMNEVVDEIGGGPDAFTAAAARRALKKVEW